MKLYMKLSIAQKNVAAEILGNTAVAWFSIGVISPLLLGPENPQPIYSLIVSFILSGLSGMLAISLVRRK